MLRLPVYLALQLVVLAKAQDILGVDYSFDVDFYRYFDNRKCESVNSWRLVAYESLDVEPPFTDDDKGIQAVGNSCATSFPIYFFNGYLEFNVYIRVISQKLRIIVEVFNEYDVPLSRFLYGPSSTGFRTGWQKLLLEINNVAKGYVNIRGRSLYNEIVLIDSFRYVPNNTFIDYHRDNKRSKNFEKEDDEEIIFKFKELTKQNVFKRNQDNDEIYDGGIEIDLTSEQPDPTGEPVIETPVANYSFWNPFTIFFVTFGIVVAVTMVAVGAYHCGKIRGRDNIAQPFFADDVDPPRTITIPRVTGVHESRSTSLIFD